MKKSIVLYTILGFVIYILVFLFFRPGYLEIFSPSHSDIFRYYTIGLQDWSLENWKSPRPLMLMYLHLIASIQNWNVFIILLTLPSLVLVILLGSFISSKFEMKPSYFSATIYFILIYSSPLFIPMYQYDIGGMLSGIFTVFLVKFILDNLNNTKFNNYHFLSIFTMSYIALEFKQTFAVSMISFSFIVFFIYKTRKTFYIFILIIGSILLNLIKDKFFNSAFMRTDTSGDVYSIIISPLKNLELLNFYILNSFTSYLAIISFISFFILYKKNIKISLVIIIFAISASVPMSLLLNREWAIYSFYSMIIFVSFIQLSIIKIKDINNGYIKMILYSSFVFLTLFHAYTPSVETNWNVVHQKYNNNILEGLDNLKNNFIGKRILIIGVQGPYHPFKSKKFIELHTNNLINNYDILLYHNEESWNNMSKVEQTNGIYKEDLNLFLYDIIINFNDKGTISGIYTQENVSFLRKSDLMKNLFLNCGFLSTSDNILSLDQNKTLKIMECLNSKLDFLGIIQMKENEDFNNYITHPWQYYYLANAYNYFNNNIEANIFIERAINIEPKNEVFLKLKSKIIQGENK